MTQFENVLETILEEYARRDSEGEFDTWEETDAFVKEKAEVLLAYAKEEPISELEEEIKRYLHKVYDRDTTVGDVARHFAKWQKEQMMAKAIEAVVSQVPCSNEIIFYNPSSVDRYYLPQEMNKLGLNKGDKVKLVIIKED